MAKISLITQILKHNIIILTMGVVTLFISWRGDYEGGDIAASRKSYLGQAPIDIWGSFSGFFYGVIPNYPVPWGMYLYTFQIVLTIFSLIMIKDLLLHQKSNLLVLSFYTLAYLTLCFATTLTRDATMCVLIIFGISIIMRSPKLCTANLSKHLIAILSISIGLALRPWLFPVTFIILLFLTNINNSKKLLFGLTLIGFALPFIFNYSVSKFSSINSVHPEIQVMIMDGGSIACLSSYDKSRNEARNFLNIINDSNHTLNDLCSNFRLNTWTTLGVWQPTLEELNIDYTPAANPNDKRTPLITIYTNMPIEKYKEIRTAWIKLILDNPKDYSRAKFIHFNQLLLLGDSSELRFKKVFADPSNFSAFLIFNAIFFMLWDLIIYFHILAPLTTILLFSFFVLFYARQSKIITIFYNKKIIFVYIFMAFYLIATTIAYIGDTGRYMYIPSILFWYFIVPFIKKVIYEKK